MCDVSWHLHGERKFVGCLLCPACVGRWPVRAIERAVDFDRVQPRGVAGKVGRAVAEYVRLLAPDAPARRSDPKPRPAHAGINACRNRRLPSFSGAFADLGCAPQISLETG